MTDNYPLRLYSPASPTGSTALAHHVEALIANNELAGLAGAAERLGLTAWVLVDRLVADIESRHRFVTSAQTAKAQWPSVGSKQSIIAQDGIGAFSGWHAIAKNQLEPT